MAQEDINAQANGTHASAPSPAEGFEVLLITGMSGAGRSHAANSIEDMGWYVADNMPPKLLVPLVDMMTTGSNIHKLAAVVDVRSRDYFDDLSAVLSHLDDLGVKTRILFLDASNEVLIKRYESVRRPHPLQQGNAWIWADHGFCAHLQFRFQIWYSHRRRFCRRREISAEPILGAGVAFAHWTRQGSQRLCAFQRRCRRFP